MKNIQYIPRFNTVDHHGIPNCQTHLLSMAPQQTVATVNLRVGTSLNLYPPHLDRCLNHRISSMEFGGTSCWMGPLYGVWEWYGNGGPIPLGCP